ncbi:MAG: TylF/MycF/NovP-related O-methyltransferase [Planctomycetota bacterium]
MVPAVFVTATIAASLFVVKYGRKIVTGEIFKRKEKGVNSRWIQRLAGGRLERVANSVISSAQMRFLGRVGDPEIIKDYKQLRKKLAAPLANEAYLLRSLAASLNDLDGDFAEVGCFQGGSAAMICQGKEGDKRMHIFDTFEGIPRGRKDFGEHFKENLYACSLEQVQANLSDFPNVAFHKGLFPSSVNGNSEIEQTKFAFVNIDVDLYEGTLECLKFFYPRMSPGGILVSHDYMLDGVRAAFDEFMADKPERIVDLPTTQCMFVKLDDQSAGAIRRAA